MFFWIYHTFFNTGSRSTTGLQNTKAKIDNSFTSVPDYITGIIDTFKKKDISGEEVIEMCWASVFIILFLGGLFILTVLILNYQP